MEPRSRTGKRPRPSEAGFTLAALLVIMSVMMIFIAYTVPQQWSLVMRRERELQTIYVMQQYAKACQAFADKHGGVYPVSMQQLVEAKQPRFLRCPEKGCVDPLTGEVDWYMIPQSQAPAPGGGQAPPGPNPQVNPQQAMQNPQQTTTGPIGIPMKEYAGGPFVGVRPNKKGSSLIILNNADHYEQWYYTALDYKQDRTNRQNAAAHVWQ